MQSFRRYFLSMLVTIVLGSAICGANAADSVIVRDNPKVTLKTNMGNIVVELEPHKAPKTVENFLTYVKEGHYKGTIFHRVIDNFMIQGGGFDQKMVELPTHDPIENEAANGLKNVRYSIAMARRGDPHSATAQFFINVADNTMLDYPSRDGWGYCVFGKVVSGTEVVDKIKLVRTGNQGVYQNVPLEPVIIESVTINK